MFKSWDDCCSFLYTRKLILLWKTKIHSINGLCALGPDICHLFFCLGAGHCQAFPARPPGIVNLKEQKSANARGLPGGGMDSARID
jgi:hypothetical protein